MSFLQITLPMQGPFTLLIVVFSYVLFRSHGHSYTMCLHIPGGLTLTRRRNYCAVRDDPLESSSHCYASDRVTPGR